MKKLGAIIATVGAGEVNRTQVVAWLHGCVCICVHVQKENLRSLSNRHIYYNISVCCQLSVQMDSVHLSLHVRH